MKSRKTISVLSLALAAAVTLSGCGLYRAPKLSDETKDAIRDAVEEAVEDVKNAAENAVENARTGEKLNERRYEITDSIDSIDLEWVSGTVDVYAAEGSAVVLVERSDDGIYDNEALTWRVHDRELEIDWSAGGTGGLSAALRSSKNLELYLPAAAWDELSLDTVSSALTVRDALTCRELSLGTTSGTIEASGLTADELEVTSVSGSAELAGSFREIKTESVSGDVSIGLSAVPTEIKMDSVSGKQTVIFPVNGGFTLKFDSVSGSLDSALALTTQDGRYLFGGGECRIEVETVSGRLALRGSV